MILFYPTMPYSNDIFEVREPQWLSILTDNAKWSMWESFQTPTTADITFSPYSTFTPPYFHYDYLTPFFKGHMAIHAATILTHFLIVDSSVLLLYMTHIDYDSYSTYINL